jgi:hypothetical protein
MRYKNQFIKQYLSWICIVVFLPAQQGCASFSLDRLFGDKKPPELGQVGIASPATAPNVRASGLSKQSGMPRNESLGGAATGGAGGVGVGFAACSPTIILPWLYPVCIATFGVTGLLVGALVGREVANVKDTETFAAVLPAGIDLQETLRTRVTVLTKNSTDKPLIDLGTQDIAAGLDKSNANAPGLVPTSKPADYTDYRKYAVQGIDTVLETSVLDVGLQAAGPGHYRLVLQCSSRLINTTDGKEIMGRTHYYSGPEFLQESETAQGTGIKLQVLNAGIESLGREIVRDYFSRQGSESF